MPADAAGFVPSSWESSAQREMFVTLTKACSVTTVPQAIDASVSALLEMVPPVCSEGWCTAVASHSRAAASISALAWMEQLAVSPSVGWMSGCPAQTALHPAGSRCQESAARSGSATHHKLTPSWALLLQLTGKKRPMAQIFL